MLVVFTYQVLRDRVAPDAPQTLTWIVGLEVEVVIDLLDRRVVQIFARKPEKTPNGDT